MANYSNLKAAIAAAIKQNGNQEITGQVLQNVLTSMVSVIGANYTFAGVATPSTNPGTPDQNVVYMASQAGMYTNFGGIQLPAGISLLMWNGSWTSKTVMCGDGGVFDISVYKSSGGTLATFADLAAALDGGNNIPQSFRKGGMSVKFVQSSDNRYVQARCMAQNFTTDVTQWQGVDDRPTANSKNLVSGEGILDFLTIYTKLNLGVPYLSMPVVVGKYVAVNNNKKIIQSNSSISYAEIPMDYVDEVIEVLNIAFVPNTSDGNRYVRILFFDAEDSLLSEGTTRNATRQSVTLAKPQNATQCFIDISNAHANEVFISTRPADFQNTDDKIRTLNSSITTINSEIQELNNHDINLIQNQLGTSCNSLSFIEGKYVNANKAIQSNNALSYLELPIDIVKDYIEIMNIRSYVPSISDGTKYTRILFFDENGTLVGDASTITDPSTYTMKLAKPSTATQCFIDIPIAYSNELYIRTRNDNEEDIYDYVDDKIIENDTLIILNKYGLFQGFLATDGVIRTDSEDALKNIYSGKIKGNQKLILPNGWKMRRICYYTNSDTFISYSNIDAASISITNNNGYCRVSLYKDGKPYITPSDFPIVNDGANPDISSFFLNPLLHFDIDYEIGDFADQLTNMPFDETFMEALYSKIDILIASNTDYITKYDAGVLVNKTYPRYANGISEGDSEYLETPAYKTYVYKLDYNGGNVYPQAKQKIFLVGGTHGWEIAGSFNLYLLMLGLCTKYSNNQFFMKLRAGYEIWILPCLNGYGIYHSTRVNGNRVDINRNAPTSNWEQYGQPGNDYYSGPSANSEFETQLVVELASQLNPCFFIDHHNYNSSNRQFYTEGWSNKLKEAAFQSLVDMSHCYLKNMPSYFGTNFQIFMEAASDLPQYLGHGFGHLSQYIFENYTDYSVTLEISNRVMYNNGVYVTNNPKHTNDAFKVGEYSLRCQLSHYLNAMMDNANR